MADPVPQSLLAALADLSAWLEEMKAPSMIIGGVAASILGRPRLTQDVDALVILPDDRWQDLMDCAPRFGIAVLLSGKRRAALETAFESLLSTDLDNRVLDFDAAAAQEAAMLAARRKRTGTTVDIRDTQIAGIALSRRAAIATRNVEHFADCGASILNPFA